MTETTQLVLAISTLVGAIGALFVSIGGMFVSLRNSRKIEEVHIATNSKMDKLLTITATASKAEGVIEGQAISDNTTSKRIETL